MKVRLDRFRLLPALAALACVACDDPPAGTARTIHIVQPLTMTWPYQDEGAPYSGGRAVFAATTALRVTWSFRIEAVPQPPDFRRPVYKQSFDHQDHIEFTWNGHNNFGDADFAPGDSCIARVAFAQQDAADADRAQVVFTIAH